MKKNIVLLAAFVQILLFNSAYSQTAAFTYTPNPVCLGELIDFTDASTPGAGTINQWSWNFDLQNAHVGNFTVPAGQNAVQNPTGIQFNAVGSFEVELSIADDQGGVSTTTIVITVSACSALQAGFTYDNNICDGDCIIFADTSTGNPGSWTWAPVNVFPVGGPSSAIPSDPNAKNTEFCFTNGSNTVHTFGIQLTVMNANGDASSVTNVITVNPLPSVSTTVDTIIELSQSVDLVAVAFGSIVKTEWEPSIYIADPSSLVTFAKPQETTDYSITVTDVNGCSATDTITAYVNFVLGLDVPSAFSPNGDGLNDLLVVEGKALEELTFKVYNRFGQLLFESVNQENGWDGNFRGRKENPGVYLWTLDYKFNTGSVGKLSGSTTLVR